MSKLSKGEEQIHCIEAQMAGRTWRGALGVAQLVWRKWRGASVAAQLAVALMVTLRSYFLELYKTTVQ
jgi:hypothetical protein